MAISTWPRRRCHCVSESGILYKNLKRGQQSRCVFGIALQFVKLNWILDRPCQKLPARKHLQSWLPFITAGDVWHLTWWSRSQKMGHGHRRLWGSSVQVPHLESASTEYKNTLRPNLHHGMTMPRHEGHLGLIPWVYFPGAVPFW